VNRQLVIAQRLVFVSNSRTLLPDEPKSIWVVDSYNATAAAVGIKRTVML